MIDVHKVADESDFSWIKVKQFKPEDYEPEFRMAALEAHHVAETKFLLSVCRALAQQIVLNNNKFFWGFEVKED